MSARTEVPAGGDPWWAEAPPDLDGMTRLQAAAQATERMWRRGEGLSLEHAAVNAVGLLVFASPDDLLHDSALHSALDAVKDAARKATDG